MRRSPNNSSSIGRLLSHWSTIRAVRFFSWERLTSLSHSARALRHAFIVHFGIDMSIDLPVFEWFISTLVSIHRAGRFEKVVTQLHAVFGRACSAVPASGETALSK